MKFLPLLHSHLKSDAMLDLFESWDAQVVYEYDRIHENEPDEYWASVLSEGVGFKFNEHQVLRCIFLHTTDADGFSPLDLTSTDVTPFPTPVAVAEYAEQNNLGVSSGQGELLGKLRDWVRLEYDDYWIHYEFHNNVLTLVTLTGVPTKGS